ncbi:hypothetical protein L3V35_08265 [Vibrio sp. L5-1]|uniref:hypothetical protein n=1 Tax=Vibrio sp. L5-1 TaxID=2912254 RepID=UPI001F1B6E3E|nr:hypothetical protein [Vibrio sp. L5-1]MCF7495041.1 hypothetical protein [Vibrio sp. L5-1]
MSNKPQVGKVETLGVGGISSFALLFVNQLFAENEWLTVIQASVPFVVSGVVYFALYCLADVDDLPTHTAKTKLRSKKSEIEVTLTAAQKRNADPDYIAELNQQLNDTEQAILSLCDPAAPRILKAK